MKFHHTSLSSVFSGSAVLLFDLTQTSVFDNRGKHPSEGPEVGPTYITSAEGSPLLTKDRVNDPTKTTGDGTEQRRSPESTRVTPNVIRR